MALERARKGKRIDATVNVGKIHNYELLPWTIDLYWLTSISPSAPSSVSGVLGDLRQGLGDLGLWFLISVLKSASWGVSCLAAALLTRRDPGSGLGGVLEAGLGTREGSGLPGGLLRTGLPGSTCTWIGGSGNLGMLMFWSMSTWVCCGVNFNKGSSCSWDMILQF